MRLRPVEALAALEKGEERLTVTIGGGEEVVGGGVSGGVGGYRGGCHHGACLEYQLYIFYCVWTITATENCGTMLVMVGVSQLLKATMTTNKD